MLKNHSLTPAKPQIKGDPLDGLDEEGMLALRREIDRRLKTDLSVIDLGEELGLNYRAGKLMLAQVLEDDQCPANQKSQVFNSVSSMLDRIVKQQDIVYSAERLKRFEHAFLKVLNQLGEDAKQVFFDLYGEFLAEKPAEK